MEIIQLHLKHFGKFTDYRLDLHAGINIISGGNESGKSTLHAFIRAMFYGIARTRSKNLDEYQLREPWENPSYFAGSMKLLYDDKIYRIERNFHRREESLEVICETDGTKAEDPQQALRCFTGGLSEADFDNTVFIRQAQSAAGTQLGERLRDYLVNMEQSADASVDVSAAQDYLKKKRRKAENEKNAALGRIEEEIHERSREMEYINGDLERLLERRSRESAGHTGTISFERIENSQGARQENENVLQAENLQAEAATDDAEGRTTSSGGRVSAQAAQDRAGISSQSGVGGSAAAVQTAGTSAAGSAGTDHEKISSDRSDQEEDDETALEIPEEEDEEPGGMLLSAAVLISFVTTGLLCACTFLTTDGRMRYVLGAGAVLTLIVALTLLWRVLHPVSKTERMRKKMKRTEFLDRHLGFREDLEDPEDRAEYLRRQREAQEAMLRAREKEEREARLREEKRRIQIDRALEEQQKEDMARRGREVAQIARSEVIDREISLRREKLDVIQEELEKLYRKKAGLGVYDNEIRAIELAQSRIRELSGNIYHESGAEFADNVSVLLAGLTEGRYTRISLDEKMLVRLNTPDRLLTLDQVSCGTMHQVYFALRLASAGLLTQDADVPVILDEPFAMYDEERLESALRFLSGCGRQVILFSCQRRELEILKKIRRV